MGNQKKAVCTIGIAAVNVIVFLLLSFGGRTEDGMYMLEHGAMYVPYVVEYKEYYRLFTCIFLHFGFSHLMNNMLTLVVVGWNVEMFVGKARFLTIYLLSGLGGNLLSMAADIWRQDYSVSAGASGAIFGLTGALLCLAILNHGRVGNITKQGMIVMILISLYTGFTSGGVDNLAHVGGLLTGILVTALLCWKRNPNVDPFCGAESTSIVPPWACMILSEIESPRPVPFFLYVVNGSKMELRCSLEIPHPLS